MLNVAVLIGRLTRDPELRYTEKGAATRSFTLAVDRPKFGDRDKEADFINIVTWEKLAEACAQHLQKGRMASVEGRLQIRSYDNKEGQKVRMAEIVAHNVRFLDRKKEGDKADATA